MYFLRGLEDEEDNLHTKYREFLSDNLLNLVKVPDRRRISRLNNPDSEQKLSWLFRSDTNKVAYLICSNLRRKCKKTTIYTN